MSWLKKTVTMIKQRCNDNIINIEAGFGPTGLPHIGTLCEILRTDLVKRQLEADGYQVNFVLISDDLDPFRKIPLNIPNRDALKKHLGKPICQVPDPFNQHISFSAMAETRLMELAKKHNINCSLIRSSDAYKSGAYNNAIITFLSNYHRLNEICGQSTGSVRQRTYNIFMPFSSKTGAVLEHIKVTQINVDSGTITYIIPSNEVVNKPGFEYAIPLSELYKDEILDTEITVSVLDGMCKLQWKADWAMRQMMRNIQFEMHGEDLRSSANVAQKIAHAIGYTPPVFYPYGLFLDDCGKKISKSKGNGFSLDDANTLLSKAAISMFLAADPKRSRRFFPAMAPRLNDLATTPSNTARSYQTLYRMICAFHPLSQEAAESFLNNKSIFPTSPEKTQAKRCIALYFKENTNIVSGLNEAESSLFITLRNLFSLQTNNPHLEKSQFLLGELKKIRPDLSNKECYQLLYRGFFGNVHGPRLTTWLNAHSDEEIIQRLSRPCQENRHPQARIKSNAPLPVKHNTLKKEKVNMGQITLGHEIDFNHILDYCALLSFKLREKSSDIVNSLSDYQCKNVTLDEIERSCDLLDNIEKNKEYFLHTIRGVTSFLPLNQPIYASVCFGFIPALMANDVCIRPPTAMHRHYKKLMAVLDISSFVDSLDVSYDEKEIFLSKRVNVTDAVIFTGTPENALKVRKHFRKDVLFILNGAGHNPLVVSHDADLVKATQSALRVVLYNQGQDCAGPNTILVHRNVFQCFSSMLMDELNAIAHQVGDYHLGNIIVGPNSDPEHSVKMASIFRNHHQYCIYGGEINPINGMIKPTIFSKPLHLGGNYQEFFAPVFFLQLYEDDMDLSSYFSHPQYKNNAMYISLFGTSQYIKQTMSSDLHKPESILMNTDLHLEERGYLPYGGQGGAASCLWINGERIYGSTLPQRDIFNHLIKPVMEWQ
ncbi:TPA: aldehyde dehydrogenase family protein [Vibrio vulnificus]|nr:aldehyde dehydrogenase family protein [Vibrio vulnificus]HAS8108155.1 aldehyde dehydrogenase family protein [Vibrio vulnificus]HAS8120966.1 aldehyde dehydrogenase family protein [Vibrio vulnificus]HAS8157865.1 aldehyde dehydrogenase family protein [Vibrio vulnificus]HAS8548733.1 aldehyde dehydrogenase family protein [Vibrio vulnificus]